MTMPRVRMICGSRAPVNKAMSRLARWLVVDAGRQDLLIVAGDAFGIDEIVAKTCHRFNIPYLAYGIEPTARNGAPHYVQLDDAIITGHDARTRYAQRDRALARLTHDAGGAIHCVWNGYSPGTKRLYLHARKNRYTAYLHQPGQTFDMESAINPT